MAGFRLSFSLALSKLMFPTIARIKYDYFLNFTDEKTENKEIKQQSNIVGKIKIPPTV